MPATSACILADYGSLAPAATQRLRVLTQALAQALGGEVHPASLQHADQIPANALGGRPAELVSGCLRRLRSAGVDSVVIVPLLFGPSGALAELQAASPSEQEEYSGSMSVRVAPPLFDAGDDRLARILADHVRAVAPHTSAQPIHVALVDHGSPQVAVTTVRDQLAAQLGELLGKGWAVRPCSMERRAGREYDFNEPLLANLLDQPGWSDGDVVLAMQFLLPGRHAGSQGDIAAIMAAASRRHPGLRVHPTRLVSEHPLLIEILADRAKAAGFGR